MRLSKYYIPVLKTVSNDITVTSHKYCLRAGLVKQCGSGIYSWLPLGLRVLRNIESVIRSNMEKNGVHEMLMPCVQQVDLWKESGRYESYGKEMLRFCDRHGREMLFGPTHEEVITDLFRNTVSSYKDLPLSLYQIQWKFRDEIRPRFGIMRGREFLMKDAYSFDVDYESSKKSYYIFYQTYLDIFRDLGLFPIAVKADSGPIGGDLTHEFHVKANSGESVVFYDKKIEETKGLSAEELHQLYAVTDEVFDADKCPLDDDELLQCRGIEVGHIFHIGTKYSEPMNANINNKNGKRMPVYMGSYGIGVSRVLAAIVEVFHDERGIKWPEVVAPFVFGLIKLGSDTDDIAQQVYLQLGKEKTLYDDSNDNPGVKFSRMDLIGIPWQIIIGKCSKESRLVEVKNRFAGLKVEVAIGNIISYINSNKL